MSNRAGRAAAGDDVVHRHFAKIDRPFLVGVLHEHLALRGLCLRRVDQPCGQGRRGEHRLQEVTSPVG
jgi:hypothetical protein